MSGFVKCSNLISLFTSYYISRYSGRNVLWGMPYSVGIEITNHCNLSCPFCASGSGDSNREKGYMSLDLFHKISTELSPYIVNTMFYFQGESMMHPRFFEMLEGAKDMGPIISTNGHFLDEESSKKLKDNSKGLGARIRFKSMQMNVDEPEIGFLPEDKRYRRYKLENDTLSIRSLKPSHCYRLWTNPVISLDGKVLPCCFDKNAEYVMGDLNTQIFEEIWKGSGYTTFRN